MIEAHTGRWGVSSYIPKIDTNVIVHIADVFCARISEVLNKDKW